MFRGSSVKVYGTEDSGDPLRANSGTDCFFLRLRAGSLLLGWPDCPLRLDWGLMYCSEELEGTLLRRRGLVSLVAHMDCRRSSLNMVRKTLCVRACTSPYTQVGSQTQQVTCSWMKLQKKDDIDHSSILTISQPQQYRSFPVPWEYTSSCGPNCTQCYFQPHSWLLMVIALVNGSGLRHLGWDT